MGKGSYIGGSTTIKIFGKTSKPNRKKTRLIGTTKLSSTPHVELLLNKIVHLKKTNDNVAVNKYAKVASDKLSRLRKTKRNRRYIDSIFSKIDQLGLDRDLFQIK